MNQYRFVESTKISSFTLQTRKVNIEAICPVQMALNCSFKNEIKLFLHPISNHVSRTYCVLGVCQVLEVRVRREDR